jgi:hypothetical protein
VKFEETREAILMIDARLTRALSISAESSKIGDRAEVLPVTSSGLLNWPFHRQKLSCRALMKVLV